MEVPITVTQGSRGPRLKLRGNIDLSMAAELHHAARTLADHPGAPAVDCRRTGHLSTAALQVLIALAADLDSRGRTLRFLCPPPALHPVLEMAGLSSRIETVKKEKG